MVRVSKNRLADAHLKRLIQQFTETLGSMSQQKAYYFVHEIFGKEEKEVFAKRLAIILMIHEKRSLYSIARLLQVSDTTVSRLNERYERGEFAHTIKSLTRNKAEYKEFLSIIDSILTVGGIMPYRNYSLKHKKNTPN